VLKMGFSVQRIEAEGGGDGLSFGVDIARNEGSAR
jgi:hypothetical protein